MTTDILPPQAIQEFKQIYEETAGLAITLEEAKNKAESFIGLFELITNQNKYEPTNTRHTITD